MYQEALEAANCVQNQYTTQKNLIIDIANELRCYKPAHVITSARGSSDHAAQFVNFLIMQHLGILTTSLPMSLITLYNAPLRAEKSLTIGISQSGQSPDVRAPLEYFKAQGGKTLALVNDETSPLYQIADLKLGLKANKENAVAATKSFICALSQMYTLISHWKNDPQMIKEIERIPELLIKAQKTDWSFLTEKLHNKNRLMVIGRGPGLSLAFESSLKFKETCQIQAEAFSSAEVKHGPLALIEKDYPILIFATTGPILPDLLKLSQELKEKGADVILAAPSFVKEKDLEIVATKIPDLDILTAIQSFYLECSNLSVKRGLNPDSPKLLSKITQTI